MSDHFDEFSKSLAEKSFPRRESLRLLGAALAGAVLSPLGVGTAWAAGRDPCKAFCKCRNKQQQNACLEACRACSGDTRRLCGSCGSYVCCAEPGPYEYGACVDGQCSYWCVEGAVDCGGFCTSLAHDPYNCGACGHVCEGHDTCVDGVCQTCIPFCPEGWCGDDGCGGFCGCPEGMYCEPYSNLCAISEPTPF